MENIDNVSLSKGSHKTRDEGMCATEFTAFLAGEEHSDAPSCASMPLIIATRGLNDLMETLERDILKPVAQALVNSVGNAEVEDRRSLYFADYLTRNILGKLLLKLEGTPVKLSRFFMDLKKYPAITQWEQFNFIIPWLKTLKEATTQWIHDKKLWANYTFEHYIKEQQLPNSSHSQFSYAGLSMLIHKRSQTCDCIKLAQILESAAMSNMTSPEWIEASALVMGIIKDLCEVIAVLAATGVIPALTLDALAVSERLSLARDITVLAGKTESDFFGDVVGNSDEDLTKLLSTCVSSRVGVRLKELEADQLTRVLIASIEDVYALTDLTKARKLLETNIELRESLVQALFGTEDNGVYILDRSSHELREKLLEAAQLINTDAGIGIPNPSN